MKNIDIKLNSSVNELATIHIKQISTWLGLSKIIIILSIIQMVIMLILQPAIESGNINITIDTTYWRLKILSSDLITTTTNIFGVGIFELIFGIVMWMQYNQKIKTLFEEHAKEGSEN